MINNIEPKIEKIMDKKKEIMDKKKEKKPVDVVSTKTTNTAFILMFPSLLLTVIAVISSVSYISLLAIGLVIYQFLLLKKFIEDYYKK